MIALFPGQGSQEVGMGKSLVENFKTAKLIFEEASDAIGKDLKKLCFEGSPSDLALTENTQPALLTCSVAAYRVLVGESGFRPKWYAGHSLGEYSALVASGALPLGTASRWVQERGRAMQRAVPEGQGGMAAVLNVENSEIETLCAQAVGKAKQAREENPGTWKVEAWVSPANFNSPGQVVIAGSKDAVDIAGELFKAAGGRVMPLAVSAPFHCKLMNAATRRMEELFDGAKPKTPAAPYIANRTGEANQDPGKILKLLVEQIENPVLWDRSMVFAMEQGVQTGVELGSGKVLQGLAKRIAKAVGKTLEIQTFGKKEELDPLKQWLKERA